MATTDRVHSTPLSSRIDPTQVTMVDRDEALRVAHAMLFPANHERGPVVTAAVALLFATVAERSAMDAQDIYLLGRRILTTPYPGHPNVQLDALRDFAGLRIRDIPAI